MWMLKMENMFNHRNNPISLLGGLSQNASILRIKPIISMDCGSSSDASVIRPAILRYLQGLICRQHWGSTKQRIRFRGGLPLPCRAP
jgi:hypothetical protein